jgi:hypothetical protein
MRVIIWTILLAALSTVWMYGCDRAARASTMVIWELVYDGNVVSFGDMDYAECAQLKDALGNKDVQCIPREVEREES